MKRKFRAWVEAARPKTLTASLSPVLIGCALAYSDGYFKWFPALLCVLVALLAQIASNFANDYYDFKKGADTAERLGPERAVASGWIKPSAMLIATFVALGLACLFGLILVVYADWQLLFVGIAIALCVLAYSAGPFPLAYNGLGDVCVLLFYGVVPVVFTYYVQALAFSNLSIIISFAVGFLSINILVVNNYRDYAQDKAAGKRTTIVLFGRKFGRTLYLINGLLALLLALPACYNKAIMGIVFIPVFLILHFKVWKELTTKEGKELNKTLGHTARNVLVFALMISAGLLIYA